MLYILYIALINYTCIYKYTYTYMGRYKGFNTVLFILTFRCLSIGQWNPLLAIYSSILEYFIVFWKNKLFQTYLSLTCLVTIISNFFKASCLIY